MQLWYTMDSYNVGNFLENCNFINQQIFVNCTGILRKPQKPIMQ